MTVGGPVDERTGEVMSRERLDRLVEERVLSRFSNRSLNDDVLFRDCVPTAEHVARVIYHRLEDPIRDEGVRLLLVRLRETRRNSFAYGEMS